MKHPAQKLLAYLACAASPLVALAANEPVIVEAENASYTSDTNVLRTVTEGSVTYVESWENLLNGSFPGADSHVLTFNVTFPEAGSYQLYMRFRTGPSLSTPSTPADDDSFFPATSFGAKNPLAGAGWTTVNQLSGLGYQVGAQTVHNAGVATTGFKWIRVPNVNALTVPAGALTQVYQIGTRENGLQFDKLAFGRNGMFYTVQNLDNGTAPSGEPLQPDPPAYNPPLTQKPLATGKPKYLGSAHSGGQAQNFQLYWNQVTPENGGKWGSVEATRDSMNWNAGADAAYNFAQANGFRFRFHVLLWGNQQPTWLRSLPPAEQLEEIEEWMQAVAIRYPNIDVLEVVNEPLHDPPTDQNGSPESGNYYEALGGAGATGWDWVVNAFRIARLYFPNTRLMLNDYSITNTDSATTTYLQIINLLKAEGLIDVIGVQAHAFSTTGSMTTHKNNLDRLAATGLPIVATEMDIDGPTTTIQLNDYQRIFPTFWDHPGVEGITLWGWRPGLWRNLQGANIVYSNGAEKPAMQWLKAYVGNNAPVVSPGQSFVLGSGAVNVVGNVTATDVDSAIPYGYATPQAWQITGGTGAAIFAINPATGQITIANPNAINFALSSYTLKVKVGDGAGSSSEQTVTVTIPTTVRVTVSGRVVQSYKLSVPALLRAGGKIGG